MPVVCTVVVRLDRSRQLQYLVFEVAEAMRLLQAAHTISVQACEHAVDKACYQVFGQV